MRLVWLCIKVSLSQCLEETQEIDYIQRVIIRKRSIQSLYQKIPNPVSDIMEIQWRFSTTFLFSWLRKLFNRSGERDSSLQDTSSNVCTTTGIEINSKCKDA